MDPLLEKGFKIQKAPGQQGDSGRRSGRGTVIMCLSRLRGTPPLFELQRHSLQHPQYENFTFRRFRYQNAAASHMSVPVVRVPKHRTGL